jgi:uridine phosphorylase
MFFRKKRLTASTPDSTAPIDHASAAHRIEEYTKPGFFSAGDLLNWRWGKNGHPKIDPPTTVILCHQPELLRYARRHYPIQNVKGFFGDLMLVKRWGRRVGLAGGFGLGSPVTAALVEEYCAFGVQRFLSIGIAGGLQPGLAAGDVLVCHRAVRGEGTSGHYLPPAEAVPADPQMVTLLHRALTLHGINFTSGTAWTTDAPYRETRQAVDHQRSAGTLAVEMEVAALFAAAQGLGVQAGAVLVVADRLLPDAWRPPKNMRPIRQSLQAILNASLPCLAGV